MNRLERFSALLIPFALALLVIIPMLVWMVPYNRSVSMPYGLYLRLPAWNVEEGDVVQAVNPMVRGYMGSHGTDNLLKRVVKVEDGMYTLRGEHPLSYDSRFFGALGEEYIVSELVPLVTWR